MNEKLGIDGEVHELKLGRSFDADGTLSFHSMYCKCFPIPVTVRQFEGALLHKVTGEGLVTVMVRTEGSLQKVQCHTGPQGQSQCYLTPPTGGHVGHTCR